MTFAHSPRLSAMPKPAYTPMETACLYGNLLGWSRQEIAAAAGVSQSTVAWHIRNVTRKSDTDTMAMACSTFRDDATRAAAVRRVSRMSSRTVRGRVSGLCPSEERVVDRVLLGEGNPQIAVSLGISLPTVKTHLHNIFNAVCVGSRRELIAYATGWLSSESPAKSAMRYRR